MRPSRPPLGADSAASTEDLGHRLIQLEEEVLRLRADNARLNQAVGQLSPPGADCLAHGGPAGRRWQDSHRFQPSPARSSDVQSTQWNAGSFAPASRQSSWRDADEVQLPWSSSARSSPSMGSWQSDTGLSPFNATEQLHSGSTDAVRALCGLLQSAVARGHSAQVQSLLSRATDNSAANPGLLQILATTDDRGRTLLHSAAEYGHAEVCTMLLNARADIHAPAGAGLTALASACLWGHSAVARCLLQRKARPEQSDQRGQSAFHFACGQSPEIVYDLLQINPDLALLQDGQGRNPLFYAVGNTSADAKMEILMMLLEAKSSASQADFFGRSALHYAASSGDIGCLRAVQALQRAVAREPPPGHLHGCQVLEAIDIRGWDSVEWKGDYTLLHWAAQYGYKDLAMYLISINANPDARDSEGRTPAAYAVEAGHADLVATLEASDSAKPRDIGHSAFGGTTAPAQTPKLPEGKRKSI